LISLYFCRILILMNKTTQFKRQTFFALLLLVVFTGSILIKPVHIVLVHHDLARRAVLHTNRIVLSVPSHHDCTICDFEFCSFIPQKQVIVPQVNIISTNEPVFRMVACFVCNSTHNFQLRAPPVS
jgi:hypothetical protein